jgi:Rps23 Pro-64 3,4-dihydroxylase Tpa1-like proline 4-hydroxylase
MSETEDIPPRASMPPYCVYRDFLDSDMHARLLAWVIQNEPKFEPTVVGDGKHDPSRRVSLGVHDFGVLKALLRQRMLDLVPTLLEDLRVTSFEPSNVELELVCSNDGAFFKRHIDTFIRASRRASDRILSAVYYFHTEPKAFSGGTLRLYPFGATETDDQFVELQPEQNTLLAFPSWVLHEVLPVRCPSRRFCDSRFNVNFWVHRHSNAIPLDA